MRIHKRSQSVISKFTAMKSLVIFFFFILHQLFFLHPEPACTTQTALPETEIRFMVLGDWGTGGSGQKAVAHAMTQKKKSDGADFVLSVGDNFYSDGVVSTDDVQWEKKFEKMYDASQLNIPFYATTGNHDYRGNVQAQIDYTKKSTRWKMPARYYSFTRGLSVHRRDTNDEVTFFAIDTDELIHKKNRVELQFRWLDSLLTACSSSWKIVYGHHPIFSNGYHGDTPLLKKKLKPILEKHHVDAYFAGHDHDLQMLKPVQGVNYIISGGGGGTRMVKRGQNTIFALQSLGFVWCSLTKDAMQIHFVDSDAKLLYSTSIRK